MNIQKVTFRVGAVAELQIQTDHGECICPLQKPAVLDQRAAVLYGLDVFSGRFPTETIHTKADPADGKPEPGELTSCTQDPEIVDLARRHASGEFDTMTDGQAIKPRPFSVIDRQK